MAQGTPQRGSASQFQPLTDADRETIRTLAKRLGAERISREIGIHRNSLAAVLIGTEQLGTRMRVLVALPRLVAEVAAFDSRGRR